MKLQLVVLSIILVLVGCNQHNSAESIMTVNGPMGPQHMGTMLAHEHVLVDFVGAQDSGPHRWDRQQVLEAVLPFLIQIRDRGCTTLIECTPAYMGRDPELLRMLADSSGLHILTNTGYYGAFNYRFLPPHAFTDTAEQLAERWITEWEQGIGDTGIRPGFIKIAVDGDSSLSPVHQKLVKAAALAHKATGLVINCHIGPGTPFRQVYEIVSKAGVESSGLIWTHAMRGTLKDNLDLAQLGVWISYDKLNDDPLVIKDYVQLLGIMKSNGLLQQVLVSHDAGWYNPAKPGGGNFRGYTAAFDLLVPALKDSGFTDADIRQIFTENPQKAYTIKPVTKKD